MDERELEIPFFERKYHARGGFNLTNATTWTTVIPTKAGYITTIERIYNGIRTGAWAGNIKYELYNGADLIWLRVDFVGVNVNEELNLTIEGGQNLTLTILNSTGATIAIQPLIVYRFEKRGARGRTHGGDKLDGWGHRIP